MGRKNHSWKGGVGPKFYREILFRKYASQELKCVHCGYVPEVLGQILAHHVDGDRNNNSPENLVPVCKRCHQMVEHDCVAQLQKITPEQQQKAEAKRTRDSKGKYTSRNKIGENHGKVLEKDNPS